MTFGWARTRAYAGACVRKGSASRHPHLPLCYKVAAPRRVVADAGLGPAWFLRLRWRRCVAQHGLEHLAVALIVLHGSVIEELAGIVRGCLT